MVGAFGAASLLPLNVAESAAQELEVTSLVDVALADVFNNLPSGLRVEFSIFYLQMTPCSHPLINQDKGVHLGMLTHSSP